jgi:hypothetical protein
MKSFFAKNEKFFKVSGIVLLVLAVSFLLFNYLNPLTVQGVSNFNSITLSDDLVVGGTTTMTGATTQTGAVTFGSTVDVTGASTFTSGTFSTTLGVTGASTFSSGTFSTTLGVTGASTFSSGTFSTTLGVTGVSTLTGGVVNVIGTENVGSLPTVVTTSVDIDNDSSPATCATITDGEIWFVHYVYANVLDNFVCTGDDCTVDVGDGGDADGLLDLDDAELQTADTEGTGAPAGWQGFMSADTRGAYFGGNGQGFIYAPSGADETIDCAFAGTDLASTTGDTSNDITFYVVYTRIQ